MANSGHIPAEARCGNCKYILLVADGKEYLDAYCKKELPRRPGCRYWECAPEYTVDGDGVRYTPKGVTR